MRLMTAGSVDDLLVNGPMTPEAILNIISQIAPALDYAHAREVLHRDLKPSNVLMDDDGGAYLTDFGIARLLGPNAKITLTQQGVVGTPSYMSPEQAQGQPLDGRSDVYSLGVMLFEMATGRRPFQSDTPYSIAVMQVMNPPPSPKSINPSVSSALEQVILKAMKKKREDRYQTAIALAESLRLAVERPADFLASHAHDTQPSPIPVREMLGATQPSAPMNPGPPTSAPPSAPSYPVAPAPRPPTMLSTAAYTPGASRAISQPVRRLRQKSGGGVWMSLVVGALIGCFLLAVVAIILLILASAAMRGDGDDASATGGASTGVSAARATSALTAAATASAGFLGIITATRTADEAIRTPTAAARTPVTDAATINDWLTGGAILYFAEREADNGSNYEIFRRTLRNDDEVQLTADLSRNQYPAVSPDGLRIVFQSDRAGGDFDLYTVNRMGGAPTTLTDNTVDDLYPAWSPDGEWIAFVADMAGDGRYQLMRIRGDGSGLEVLLATDARISHPAWSPDGGRLIYVIGEPFDARTWNIGLLDVASRQPRLLTDDDVRDAWPTFHPDGASILYVSDVGGDADSAGLTRINRLALDADGAPDGPPEVIYEEGDFVWGLSYTPDGQFVSFNAGEVEDGAGEVYLVSADEGAGIRRRLTTNGGAAVKWMP
jgi:hypothetical protein